MNLTECPYCGAKLPLVVDAFCPECRGELSAPPTGLAPSAGGQPPEPVAAQPLGLPLGRILGGIGALAGVANGVASLGAADGVAERGLIFMAGYLFGSAAAMGLIGLAFGLAFGLYIRLIGRRKNQPQGSGKENIQDG
jgi:hypothetical protein